MTIEARKQRAMERIVSDPALTNDLTDRQARHLLDWVEEQVICLVEETRGLDEEEAWERLAPRLQTLRHQVRRMTKTRAQTEEPDVPMTTLESMTTASEDVKEKGMAGAEEDV